MGARERIMKLVDGERTVNEIAALAYTDKSYVYRVLSAAAKDRAAHIKSWKATRTNTSAVYELGPGPDAPREPTSSTQRVHAMIERMSADDKDRYRNRQNTKRRKIKVDPLTAAFFGGVR